MLSAQHTMKTTSAIALACLLGAVFLNNVSAQSLTNPVEAVRQRMTDKVEVWYTVGNLSVDLLARAWGSPIVDLERKSNRFQDLLPKVQINVLERGELGSLGGRLTQLMNTQRYEEAGRTLDRMLAIAGQRGDLPKYDREAEMARERRAFLERARACRRRRRGGLHRLGRGRTETRSMGLERLSGERAGGPKGRG